MSSMVYATTVVLRHPGPDEFARVLTAAPCGTRYHDTAPARATARSRFQVTADESLTPMVPPEATTGEDRPRWTQERIDALPRTSGSLTRLGDEVVRASNGSISVKCSCSGGSERCRKQTIVPAVIWANAGRRPQSCQKCADKRKTRVFTPKGASTACSFISAPRLSERKVAVR